MCRAVLSSNSCVSDPAVINWTARGSREIDERCISIGYSLASEGFVHRRSSGALSLLHAVSCSSVWWEANLKTLTMSKSKSNLGVGVVSSSVQVYVQVEGLTQEEGRLGDARATAFK
jgi:hypothetical protein